MKVLVTGASGLLGRLVAQRLVARGDSVRTFQRSASGVAGAEDARGALTDEAALRGAVEGVDAVVHLAAKVSMHGPEDEYMEVNVGGTMRLIDAMQDAHVDRLVNVSSPSVAHFGTSIVGDGAGAADAARARGPYARTKAAAEQYAMGCDSSRFLVTTVRPHIVWGPGDTQLTERIVERSAAGRLPLLSHGSALIDTTYSDNAADAIVAALDRIEHIHGESFVITNGEPRTVREILAGICWAADVRAPSLSVPGSLGRLAGRVVERFWQNRPQADEPPLTEFLAEQLSTAHWFDQRRTHEALQWQPEVSIDEGFRLLRAHYQRAEAPRA